MPLAESTELTMQELQLAARNHGMPLEVLAYDITPVGLHYLLVHYDIPQVDIRSWRLRVGGHVQRELRLSIDDLRARPATTHAVTMECAGNGRARLEPRPLSQPWLNEAVGTAEWTGTPLWPILEEAGIRPGAVEAVFRGLDRGVERGVEQWYQRSLSLDEAKRDEVLLAYGMNGSPLLPQHGFPLRLLVPGWYGMTQVKWLGSIDIVTEPFTGFQQSTVYRYKLTEEEAGDPVTRMRPRSLMQPPGVPDFFTRERYIVPAPLVLRGRAWSGWAPVTSVEVSVDGGASWRPAELGDALSPHSWRPWSFLWKEPRPGKHLLSSRASDAAGNLQPIDQPWNLQGMGNNMAQRVEVVVRPDPLG